MKFGSVCSGIEAASVAFSPLGWKAEWFAEIEPFPCAVLAHHYPDVPNLGDMTRIVDDERFKRATIDVLCGGTPCQSFSVAGLRKGLDDPRGNLALEFLRIADRAKPKWILWENVPGVLSSNGGKDFAAFVTALGEIGYGWAYRILDAQHFGVPQRRRRVFVVGHSSGDWRYPAAVLFEPQSLCWDPTKSPKTKQKSTKNPQGITGTDRQIINTLTARMQGSSGWAPYNETEHLIPVNPVGIIGGQHPNASVGDDVAPTLTSAMGMGGGHIPIVNDPNAQPKAFRKSRRAQSKDDCETWVDDGIANTLNVFDTGERDTHAIIQPVAVDTYNMAVHDTSQSLTSAASDINHTGGVIVNSVVRRLTPTECERLQGFPDGYTAIPYKGKTERNCSDGPRYKALGNSWAVPCVRWIGRRIQMVEDIIKGERK